MIRVIHHWEVDSPQLFCDHCGSRIVTAADGNVSWAYDPHLGVPLDHPIIITHKRCTADYETAHGGTTHWAFMDLTCFLLQLCTAAHVTCSDATATIDHPSPLEPSAP